ncbi:amidohydrolase [Frigidibacter albus]|uniref:Amidohydrolase n=1 Tax=Frigidibacter albus TaxID=1465486 RepID=A0A6L8VHS9_9RHOB|nr:M20 aminoacylase family protein [Frigidibacter albus]MZQ89271.1 amidohydrolase [Frigidibacter albus]NBE31177.1 amidohydrolase [Frigidibacter albus]GGH53309.1 amidohydrolase [Frigidibacter albus]
MIPQSALDDLIAIRRDIHAHPELGMEEQRTSALVAQRLRDWGIETVTGLGKTGVVGVIKGHRPGQRMIGLRADMDALPIAEATGLPWASQTPGVMHACGHDGHTTMLLGAARYLAENRDFAGTAILIFQPAEEGRGGARAMVADGLFDRYPCDAIYGMHNWPGAAVGTLAARSGPVAAAGDRWRVTFRGTGGHGGATPHLATDVTVVAGHFLLGVQTIVSRNVAPQDTAVISVGHIAAGALDGPNIMPSECLVAGVCRSYLPHVRETLKSRLIALAETLAAAQGCTADIEYWRSGYAVINAEEPAVAARAAAIAAVGENNFVPDRPPSTGGEDFAEMMQVVPGCMVHLGNGADGEQPAPRLHRPDYDFNDAAIPHGVAFWINLVQQELGGSR